jgi:nucleoside-diphosphate-sugar epimerase
MRNLVIGNTSQLSHYFPKENFDFISSRNINYNSLNENYDKVFLCFGESRKFLEDKNTYDDINFFLTLKIIDFFKDRANKVIIYSTCELWNQYSGPVDLKKEIKFFNTSYLSSKFKITDYILKNNEIYRNVLIMFPFNFNSIYRNENFLFGKIFNSIINKQPTQIGNTYFYRDIIHPKLVVKTSLIAEKHQLIGSGRMIFVNDFIKDLYHHFNLRYDNYITENFDRFNEYEKNNEYYLKSDKCLFTYKELLNYTIEDIESKL